MYKYNSTTKESTVLPMPHGPLGSAHFHFCRPQPDTSLHSETRRGASASRGVSVYFPAEAGPQFTDPERMEGSVGLVCWLHTKMVYPPKDSHPTLEQCCYLLCHAANQTI